jgi:dynein light chain roadblock-type
LSSQKSKITITENLRQASTSTIPLASSQATSASAPPSITTIPTSPELEQTLALLSSHRSVLGYLLLSRGQPVSIIRHSGVVFEGDHGKKYATAVGKIIESVQGALEEVSGEVIEGVCSVISASCASPLRHDSG